MDLLINFHFKTKKKKQKKFRKKKSDWQLNLPPFCFPSGVDVVTFERTASLSARNEIIFGSLDKVEDSNNSFVFLITGGVNVYYGVCVIQSELLDVRKNFFKSGI